MRNVLLRTTVVVLGVLIVAACLFSVSSYASPPDVSQMTILEKLHHPDINIQKLGAAEAAAKYGSPPGIQWSVAKPITPEKSNLFTTPSTWLFAVLAVGTMVAGYYRGITKARGVVINPSGSSLGGGFDPYASNHKLAS